MLVKVYNLKMVTMDNVFVKIVHIKTKYWVYDRETIIF